MNIETRASIEQALQLKITTCSKVQTARNSVVKIVFENGQVAFLKTFTQIQALASNLFSPVETFIYEVTQSEAPNVLSTKVASPNVLWQDKQRGCYLFSEVKASASLKHSPSLLITGLAQIHGLLHLVKSDATLSETLNLKKLQLDVSADAIKQYLFDEEGKVQCLQIALDQAQHDATQSDYQGLLHGDLSAGNVFITHRFNETSAINTATELKLGLIDWEYSVIGDVRWDLATYAIEYALSLEEYRLLCVQYVEQVNSEMNVDANEGASINNKCNDGSVYQPIQLDEFLNQAAIWPVLYWLVTVDWAFHNDYDFERYKSMKPTVDTFIADLYTA